MAKVLQISYPTGRNSLQCSYLTTESETVSILSSGSLLVKSTVAKSDPFLISQTQHELLK